MTTFILYHSAKEVRNVIGTDIGDAAKQCPELSSPTFVEHDGNVFAYQWVGEKAFELIEREFSQY